MPDYGHIEEQPGQLAMAFAVTAVGVVAERVGALPVDELQVELIGVHNEGSTCPHVCTDTQEER